MNKFVMSDKIDINDKLCNMTSIENMEVDEINHTEDKSGVPTWSKLPSCAVEKVYSFLNRRDQFSMSLVCRNWNEEYKSPNLWRKFTFRFFDSEHLTGMHPGVIFARRFGAWFHHVKIKRPRGCDVLVQPGTVMWQLELFLEALTCKSQLLSISFKDVTGNFLSGEHDGAKDDIYQMILNFVKSQNRLQSFKIIFGSRYDKQILEALYVNNLKTLRYLNILSCHPITLLHESADITVDEDSNFLFFMNLEVLKSDFTPMLAKMMLSFYEYRNGVDLTIKKGCLKRMKIVHDIDSPDQNPLVWKHFRKIFPDLRVYLSTVCGCDSISFSKCIVPEMPVIALDIYVYPDDYADNEIGSLLRHFTSCGINKLLELLDMRTDVACNNINFAQEFTSFTNVCPQLTTVELHMQHPVVGLEYVFRSWRENGIKLLRYIDISILGKITQEEKMTYRSISDFYAPLFDQLGMTLKINVK